MKKKCVRMADATKQTRTGARRGVFPMHEQELTAALAADLDGTFACLVVTFQDRLYAFALRHDFR